MIMDQSTEAIYKLCALIALLGLASPCDNKVVEPCVPGILKNVRNLRTNLAQDLNLCGIALICPWSI